MYPADLNVGGAQSIHDEAREADPEHDQVTCWCCCIDCDFDFELVMRNSLEWFAEKDRERPGDKPTIPT